MKNFIQPFLFISIIVLLSQPIGAQPWHETRSQEAILFTGNSIPRFIPAPISHIFVCAYNQQNNSWRELTTQVDELDGKDGYFGTNYNAVLDTVDEFLFMASEAGDYAPPTSWLPDEDSKQYVRYEFELTNPDAPLNKKYVYVFRSSTYAHDPSLPRYYIKYVPATSGASDTVRAAAYLEGHNSKGIPDVWRIADSSGNYGPDLLDRQKARANGKYKYLFVTIDYKMTEDDLIVEKLEYKRGPIRIIRDIVYKTKFSGIDVNLGTFQYLYYPYRIVALGANKTLDTDYGVKLLRQSFDLNENATGMRFNNPHNSDILIDGIQDSIIGVIQPSPTMNWYSYSGAPGTIVMLNEFTTPENATETLYYQESLTGETADGTADTGDGRSYGDAGILFQGSKMKGAISLPYFTYFLPYQDSSNIGESLVHQAQNPLSRETSLHSHIPPATIAISLPDTAGPSQYPLSIPVTIGNTTGLNISSGEILIQFDTTIVQLTGLSTQGTLIENWKPPLLTIHADTAFISLTGTEALQDSGVLVYLNFNVIGSEGAFSPLHFIQVRFNIWQPLALPTDGQLTVLPPPKVAVNIPPSSGAVNAETLIPIRVDDVTGLNITSCTLELQFNKFVLDAIGIITQGTLASPWSQANFTDGAGYLKIQLSGEPALGGSGTLIWIKFKVVGSVGQSSDITFKSMVFNQGIPLAQTTNGRFTINAATPIDAFVTIADTTVMSGERLHLPITFRAEASYQLLNYQMNLSFDETVLKFNNVDPVATLTANWTPPLTQYASGKLSISSQGETPLSMPQGILIFLDFEVVGADSSSTLVHFTNMTFNSGTYIASVDDGTIVVQGVVPIELSSFIATAMDNQIKLEWTTASESNNFGFFIERRSGQAENWRRLGFVKGAGTTAVPQHYGFIDAEVTPGSWEYRLLQQDLNGHVTIYPAIAVQLAAPTRFALHQNYPNPFNATTQISYDLPTGVKAVKLMIFDAKGRAIRTVVDQSQPVAGKHTANWDGTDEWGRPSASGIYFYRLQADAVMITKKMVLTK
ncbi:MAG: cohesin domain-containing protein [candidate division KSB1 bacterium]|nr:cohesin domain-containing protein [candidate division KSB1 bacterium]